MEQRSDIIGMREMNGIFSVTDACGISREAIRVPLEKADPGSITRDASGTFEIVVPATTPLAAFLQSLEDRLKAWGYEPAEPEEES